MSLAIETDLVTRVLLADGWHDVEDKSFEIDSYEFMWLKGMGETPMLRGGQDGLVPAAGYCFKRPNGHIVCGPLTAILAVEIAWVV